MNRLPKNALYHLALTLLLTGMLTILPLCAWGLVSATWDLSTSGGVKTYTYTFTDNIEPYYRINGFALNMGEESISLMSNISIATIYHDDGSEFPTTEYFVSVDHIDIPVGINTAKSLRVRYTAPADVPTVFSDSWAYSIMHSNGKSETISGYGYALPRPFPVPEPSSLAGLGLAVSTFGLGILKRRRK